jgi:proteasome assembly chaperone (PAC2) family protein
LVLTKIERFNGNPIPLIQDSMDVQYLSKPEVNKPTMIAAWPGMGYLAKISADYIRRRIKAKKFAEITYFHNVLVYNKGKAELAPIRHKLFFSKKHNLIICVGDAQPSIPEESLRLAERIVDIAIKHKVKRIYTMAAYPNEYYEKPKVYGVYTHENIRPSLEELNIKIIDDEGAVNGLNGVMIGVAGLKGIEGVCLMCDITYANVPQHLSSKAVLEVLGTLIGLDIDTVHLEKRAKRIDSSIRKRLDIYEEEEPIKREEKKLGYIS